MNNMGAKISILQIATPQMVYIFGKSPAKSRFCHVCTLRKRINFFLDIVKGGTQLFEQGGLKELLQDPCIMKITHDCRYFLI